MPSAYAIFHRGKMITPSDGTNQAHQFSRVYCVTAGNLVFTMIDADTGLESADITVPLTGGQRIDVTPIKVKVATTGTYLGLIGS